MNLTREQIMIFAHLGIHFAGFQKKRDDYFILGNDIRNKNATYCYDKDATAQESIDSTLALAADAYSELKDEAEELKTKIDNAAESFIKEMNKQGKLRIKHNGRTIEVTTSVTSQKIKMKKVKG